MAIQEYDLLDKPYDDSVMVYDYVEQRYVPLVDGILEQAYVNLVVDWKTKENAQSYLDLLSRVIYEVIYSFKDPKYVESMRYYLAHSTKARIELFKMFSDTAWYNRRDGGFMMAYNSGANLNQGKLIEFGIDKAISPIAKQIVKNTFFASRHMPIDISKKETFDTFDDLKVYLVLNGYITQTQSDEALVLKDLPYDSSYDVDYVDYKDEYIFTDLHTLRKAIENKRIYNSQTGTW
ncbi:MAG: hypothetical protein RBQ97_07510 [Acholeplasma sp.]|nr:hypothetical protein [Acholeplasma sp.]